MSAQLSLDALSGISWSSPTLAQLEQFAIDNVPGCVTRMESHDRSMCVRFEKDGAIAWIRPSLERTEDDRLECLVRLEYTAGKTYRVPLRSDEELKQALEDLSFEDW